MFSRYQCDYNGTVFLEPCPEDGWFECNCTYQEPSGIAIWEPCNYASNLAYDRCPFSPPTKLSALTQD